MVRENIQIIIPLMVSKFIMDVSFINDMNLKLIVLQKLVQSY